MGLIPKEPSAPGLDVDKLTILLVGSPKSGKTTIATSAEGTLLIATEVGYKTIPGIHPVFVDKWDTFLKVVEEARSEAWIKRVVVDTYSKLARLAQAKACADLSVEHPADAAYGKGFDRLNGLVLDGMTALSSLDRQVVFITHTRESVKKSVLGEDKTVISADLPASARRFIAGEAQAILYLGLEQNPQTLKDERRLYFKGREDLEIGGRYLPNADIPDFILVPDLPKNGWPVVEAVLHKAFQGVVGGNGQPRRRLVKTVGKENS